MPLSRAAPRFNFGAHLPRPASRALLGYVFCFHAIVELFRIPYNPMMDNPFISSSFRDFWSVRWNMLVKQTLHRLTFEPTMKFLSLFSGPRNRDSSKDVRPPAWHAAVAAFNAFIFSGLMHEWLIFALMDIPTTGEQMVFFLIHGVVTVGQVVVVLGIPRKWKLRSAIDNMPLPVAMLITDILMIWFAPFFLNPYVRSEFLTKISRLPTELRRLAVRWAGILTQFSTGLLLSTELGSLSVAQQERIWAEAFEHDFQGDLAALPHLDDPSRVLPGIRTPAMLERAREAGLVWGAMVEQVAIRHGWTHMLDFGHPSELAMSAAAVGDEALLRNLVQVHGAHVTAELANIDHWAFDAAEIAAATGNLELVEWMHSQGIESRSTLHSAAVAGQLHIVRWLFDHNIRNLDENTLGETARNGHLDVLIFLREQLPQAFDNAPSDEFDYTTDLRVLKWLHSLGKLDSLNKSLTAMIDSGDIEGVRWVCDTAGVRITRLMFLQACAKNRAQLARWMLTQPGIAVDESVINNAIWSRAMSLISVLMTHSNAAFETVARKMAIVGDCQMIEWMHLRHSGSVTQRTLELAVEHERVDVVRFLLDQIGSVRWDLDAARLLAARRGRPAAAAVLDEHAARSLGGLPAQAAR
nr:hypothetical protein HK105_002061 [Polyrhizophydium stewartii]